MDDVTTILRTADAAMAEGDAPTALAVLRPVMDSSADPPPSVAVRLADALAAVDAAPQEIEPVLFSAVTALPERHDLVVRWGAFAVRRWGKEGALARLRRHQSGSARGHAAILFEIGRQLGSERLFAEFASQVDDCLVADPVVRTRDVWRGLAEGAPVGLARSAMAGGASLALLALRLQRDLRRIRAGAAGSADPSLSDLAVAEMVADLTAPVPSRRVDRIVCSERISEQARRVALAGEAFCNYQRRLLRDGRFRVRDPFAGTDGTVDAIDSFVAFDKTVYVFRSREYFALVAGGMASELLAAIFPGRGAVLEISPKARGALAEPALANVIVATIQRVAEVGEALATAPPPRHIVPCAGGVENFAHQLWNTLAAIEDSLETLARLPTFRFFGTQFFGELTEIFPELTEVDVVSVPSRNRETHGPPPDHALFVSIGAYVFTRDVVDRVRTTAAARADRAVVERVRDARERGAVVVWFGLRVGDKAWAEQTANVVAVVDALRRRWPDVLIVLDTFSFPDGPDFISERWKPQLGALRRAAAAIVDQLGEDAADRVVDLTGHSLSTAIAVAGDVTVYVTPLGTTQHKVGWFSRGFGIVLAGHRWRSFASWNLPGIREGELAGPVEFVFGDAGGGGASPRGLADGRPNIDNVVVESDVVLARIVEAVEERFPASGARQSGNALANPASE